MRLFSKIWRTGVATEPLGPAEHEVLQVGREIDAAARRLFGRALAIRDVDAGSCNGCEVEIGALPGPIYDMERFGLHFVASPRHADLLLVTGPVTRNMEIPLRKTYEAMPHPKLVVAVGDCAHDCGLFAGSYAVAGAVSDIIPVDVTVRGCPPEPGDILRGILAAIGQRLPHDGTQPSHGTGRLKPAPTIARHTPAAPPDTGSPETVALLPHGGVRGAR